MVLEKNTFDRKKSKKKMLLYINSSILQRGKQKKENRMKYYFFLFNCLFYQNKISTKLDTNKKNIQYENQKNIVVGYLKSFRFFLKILYKENERIKVNLLELE